MTELEKLLSGLDFNSRDTEVEALSRKAQKLCHDYNMLPTDAPERAEILSELVTGYNPYVFIEEGFHCSFGRNIHFKGMAILNFNCTLLDSNIITIGNLTLIGPGCHIICTNHSIDHMERRGGLFHNKPVTIGDHVWLGANVTVCPGVTIGDRCRLGCHKGYSARCCCSRKSVQGTPQHYGTGQAQVSG